MTLYHLFIYGVLLLVVLMGGAAIYELGDGQCDGEGP